MKKLLAMLLVLAMISCLFVACANNDSETDAPTAAPTEDTNTDESKDDNNDATEPDDNNGDVKIAMITDYGDITDQSFNQTTYEACQKFAGDNGYDFKYYKPTDNSTAGRVASTELAIADGYNVIVMPGYAFGGTIVEVAPQYPDVKFIALDVAKGDLLEAAVANAGETYDYNPDNWNLADYVDLSNVYCAVYQEELSGYMAGYAAVCLGYTKLGFLGGMAVPAVIRFGYGFVQGVDAAAAAKGVEGVEVNYIYGGQFYGDGDITAVMDTWYSNGTQLVFACGGGIFTSAAEAAQKVNGKVIGVDTDQSAVIDGGYGEGMTLTSAMKGLAPTTIDTLTDVIVNGNWANYAGKIETLGLVSDTDPSANYVQLPLETTQWEDGKFTVEDYTALVADMFNGKVKVSNDTTVEPTVSNISVNYLGNIKG